MGYLHIDSVDNKRVKTCSELIKSKSARTESGRIVVENAVMLNEALRCGVTPVCVYCEESAIEENKPLIQILEQRGTEVFTVSARVMKKLTALEVPQGICGIVETGSLPKLAVKKNGRYVICEHISDPGNLGTIIRTADAMGFDGVIVTNDSVEYTSPKAARATMGSIFRVPVSVAPSVSAACDALHEKDIHVFAAVLNDCAVQVDTIEDEYTRGGVAVIIGNEARGLTQHAIDASDEGVYIPMSGEAESLNAAVAASIFTWIFRKRGE